MQNTPTDKEVGQIFRERRGHIRVSDIRHLKGVQTVEDLPKDECVIIACGQVGVIYVIRRESDVLMHSFRRYSEDYRALTPQEFADYRKRATANYADPSRKGF